MRVIGLVALTVLAAEVLAATPSKGPKRGADVSFGTLEAEAVTNKHKATVVTMTGLPGRTDSTPQMEASGRAFVELSTTGQYVEFPRVPACNTIVIRHCIPDAPNGGGITATLSVYVNGKFRQSLTLSSKHNWLYGPAGENGQSNDPSAGKPHVFWDESRHRIEGGLKAGDTIRLQKDAKDDAAFYRIDLIDLEQVGGPLEMPVGAISAKDFGAKGDGKTDDSVALQRCIDAAKAQGKTAWIPPGVYLQSTKLVLDGVTCRGAGMWHTQIVGTVEGTTWGGNTGFELKGDGPRLMDLSIDSDSHTARTLGCAPISGRPSHFAVEHVWVTHTGTGVWMGGTDGVVRGCRVRCTYADGINLNSGASRNLVEHNHVRGSGDDGIALLSETERNWPMSQGNTVRFNTVVATWWGHNCDLAGGSGHVIEDNVFADNARFGCFTINLPSAYPMYPQGESVVRRNMIVRGGGNYAGQRRGAVTIFAGSTTIDKVTLSENVIAGAIFRGIHLMGSKPLHMLFDRNVIEQPGEAAVYIDDKVTGAATFTGNVLKGGPKLGPAVVNRAGAEFKLVQTGNTWK
jgi:hypothetical protein